MRTTPLNTGLSAAATAILFCFTFARATAAPIEPTTPSGDSTNSVPVAAATANSSTDAGMGETIKLETFTVATESPSKFAALDAVSSSRIRADLLATPASVSVVTDSLLKALVPDRVYDALQYLPGVTDANSPNVTDRVMLRGFATNQAEYVDGIARVSNAVNQNDSIMVQRIEMIGGPNALIAANGIPGGTVNVILKTPEFNPSGYFAATVGHFNANRTDLDVTGPLGDKTGFAYRVIASYQDTDKVSHGSKFKQTLLSPMLTYKGKRFSVTYRFFYQNWCPNYEGSLPLDPSAASIGNKAKILSGISFYAYLAPANLLRASNSKTQDLNFTADLTSHIATRVHLNYFDSHYGSDLLSLGGALPLGGATNPITGLWTPGVTYGPGPTYTPSPATQPDWTNVPITGSGGPFRAFYTVFQNDFVAKYDLPFRSQSITTVGWNESENKDYQVTNTYTANNVNIYAPVYNTPIIIGKSTNTGADARAMGAFFLQRLSTFGGRMLIDAGVQATANRSYGINYYNNAVTISKGNTTTWLGSLMFLITSNISAYGSFSENGAPVSTGLVTDPVATQIGKQKEGGLKGEFFKRRLRVTAAYYDITQTNFQLQNYAFVLNPQLPQYVLVNLKSYGEEFAVVGQLTDNIDLIANYSHNHIRDPYGRRLRAVADDSTATLLSYTWHRGILKDLSVSGGLSYLGSRAGDSQTGVTSAGVPIQPTFYLPPLTTVRAGAEYTYGRYFFRLTLENLLNEKFVYASSRTVLYAGMPFNWKTQVGLRF